MYGRLCNVACLAPAAARLGLGRALNAALGSACSPAATLVVADRPAAYAAVEAFTIGRVGTVTCRVLSELPQASIDNGD